MKSPNTAFFAGFSRPARFGGSNDAVAQAMEILDGRQQIQTEIDKIIQAPNWPDCFESSDPGRDRDGSQT